MKSEPLLESVDPHATRRLLAAQRGSSPKGETERLTRDRGTLPERIDRYVVSRQLGQGAYGKVYLARDEYLQRHVAVKISQRKSDPGKLSTQEYLTEARMVAKLDHPNIVPVYDVGCSDAGDCYIVSKFIEGVDLDALAKAGGLSLRESVRIVAVIAGALDYAHRQAVIHRDVKPPNILLDLDMTPFIADFGVATEAHCAIHAGQQLAGTPLYMSPEQFECASYLLDGRSDVFSLGVVLYQLLTGVLPFAANSLDDLKWRITEATPVAPGQLNSAVPDRLAGICLRAMAKARADRYETAGQFASALVEWMEQPCDGIRAGDGCAGDKTETKPDRIAAVNTPDSPTHTNLNSPRRQYWKSLVAIGTLGLAVLLAALCTVHAGRVHFQTLAVNQIEACGSTVVYDYQIDERGQVNLAATSPLARDWSHSVVRVYLGAGSQSFTFDGHTVEVVEPVDTYCPLEPVRYLRGLRHLSFYRRLNDDDLKVLGALSDLESIHFYRQPSRAALEQVRSLLPDCRITVSNGR